jgi:hypothetical protein
MSKYEEKNAVKIITTTLPILLDKENVIAKTSQSRQRNPISKKYRIKSILQSPVITQHPEVLPSAHSVYMN